MSPSAPAPDRLTRREREIVNALFALGNNASAEDIRGRLSHPPGDSAVRVMLARLEKKGVLRHRQAGARYIYSATVSPATARRGALRQLVQTFFAGSLPKMTTALIAEHDWTEEELQMLEEHITRVRRERKDRE